MSAKKSWPRVRPGDPVDCFNCGRSLQTSAELRRETGFSAGKYAVVCVTPACGMTTYFDVEEPAPRRPLIVGEDNPRSRDPKFDLYPLPRGCAGDRLARLMGLRRGQYLRAFERRNLCRGKWSDAEGRDAAREILREPRTLVLLGAKVRAAFGLAGAPNFEVRRVGDFTFVLLPHPSGRCRIWNAGDARERALSALRAAGVLLVSGSSEEKTRHG